MAISEELRIEILAQSQQAVKEFNKVEKATGGLGKSMKALGIAAAAALAVRQITKYAKASVDAYKTQQTAVNNLNSALAATGQYSKETSKDLQSYASELQGITVVGDEATLATLQLGVNMGLSAEQAKEAAKGAIGMSRAYGVDLNTAMRAVTASVQGNHSMLSRYMPQIRDAKDEAEKMAMVQESLASAFAVAEGETLTLAGAQQQMKNALGDMGEIVGSILAPALMGMAQSTKGVVESIQAFLQEDSNIDKIATAVSAVSATFSTMWEVAKQVFNNIIDAIKIIFAPISDLVGSVGEATFVFDILAGIMEVVGAASRVVATVIREQIETIIQFGKAAAASFDIIKAGVDRLKGDISKEEFRAIANDAGAAWKGVGEEIIQNFTEPFNVAVDEGRSFLGNVRGQAEEYKRIWTNAKNGAYEAVSGSLSGTSPPPGGGGGGGTGSGDEETPPGEVQLSAAQAYYNNLVSMKQDAADREAEIDQAFHDAKMQMIDDEVSKRVEMMNAINAQAEAVGGYIGKVIQGEMSMAEAAKAVLTDVISTMLRALGQQYAVEAAAALAASIWPPNPAGMAKAAGLGAASAGAFAAAGLVKSFATGGVVPGTSYTGDNVPALVNSGEMILNQGQQSQLFSMLNGGGGGGVTIVINGAVGGQEEVAEWIQEGLERAKRTGRVAA